MDDIKRTVIAFGDGGIDTRSPLLDLYVLAASGKKNPKICLLPTASGDNSGLIHHFENVFGKYPCDTSVLTLFNPHTADIEGFLLEQDIVYVTGGQSKSMMAVWRGWEVDKFLRRAYDNGTVLAGGSAGAVCWFKECITDSIPGKLSVMPCMDIIKSSYCPHFLSQERRAAYARFIKSGEISAGYATSDYSAVHFVNGEFYRAVSNRAYSKCYHLSMNDGVLKRERLDTQWLGVQKTQDDLIFNTATFA